MRNLFLLLAAILLTAPAFAADLSGRWLLKIGDTAIMAMVVDHTATGWHARWQRPTNFLCDEDGFSHLTGPAIERAAMAVRDVPGGLELSFDDPRPGATPDVLILRPTGAGTAELRYPDYPMTPPWSLVRSQQQPKLGGWDANAIYLIPHHWTTNPEMTAIFDADQGDRHKPGPIDWKVVGPADEKRRARTQALLDAGQLDSGEDYYHAAFLFQHGSQPGDYLKAHALAVIAAARGKSSASWIAAATLDRYLQSIGQPQIYGTQFRSDPKGMTQEPYRRDLISDALRLATHVPAQAEQEAQWKMFAKKLPAPKP